MQKLFVFFVRFRVFLFFLVLQAFSLVFYLNYTVYQRSVVVEKVSFIHGGISSWVSSFKSYFNLKKRNQELLKENAKLRGVAFDSYYQLQRPSFLKGDTLYRQKFRYIPALIINAPINQRNNYFTIDVGSNQGVKKGMGVISSRGIVGIVFSVSENYSILKSILTSDINIDVIIGRKEIRGMLKWDGKTHKIGRVFGVSTDISIPKWSEVKTQGSTGIFPKGVLIGKVLSKQHMEDQSLWDINVLFHEDFTLLHSVYIIKSLEINEINRIQRSIPKIESE